jgi:uncharacterized protein with HEPN domain
MKSDLKYLQHILESTYLIENFVWGLDQKQFSKNIEKQFAVIRGLEIIGEAVKNLSEEMKRDHPEIVWREIAGTRDILIHSYFSVDLDLVWNIIQRDLPKLKEQIKKVLKK